MRTKSQLISVLLQVQVIPWVISDSNYVRCPAQRLDPSKTVFVGALHGMLNAEALASIMNDLFGGVMYAGIDTDKHKYPIGNTAGVSSGNLCCRVELQQHWLKFVLISTVLLCRFWTCHFQQPAQLSEGCVCSVCGDQNSQVYKKSKNGRVDCPD